LAQFTVNLSDHNAIITGGGAGIGRAVALSLADSGAAVSVNDLNPDRAESVAEAIRARGGRALGIQGDVSNRFQAAAIIEQTRDAFGRVHLFVNAAGIFKQNTPFAKLDEWDWRRQLDVNLTGTFFCTQLIGRVMADEGGGGIVNIASNVHDGTLENGAAYVATKSGIVALTRQAARELAPSNIRVNAVCPGNIDADGMPPTTPNLLNRTETPEAVADVVLFLCSDAARFITGQALRVDGGTL